MRKISDLISVKERVAIVTGGAGFIGKAVGETLAELGARVVVLDLDQEKCEETAASFSNAWGIETLPLSVDLANEEEVRAVPERVLTHFGRIDVLVNCAAYVGTSGLEGWAVPFQEQKADAWRKAMEVNITSVFILIQSCVKALRESRYGSIINIGSTYGVVGPDWRLYEGTSMGNPAAYAASKGGLLQLTRWLATTLAPEVRVNSISPGGVYRQQPEEFVEKYVARTPLGRMATEEDFKGAIAYLASDMSAYVTGQNLMIDGGWTAW